MRRFSVRAELHHENNYHEFHQTMERRGFRRTVLEGGKLKDLPTGTYLIDTDRNIHEVVIAVIDAARDANNSAQITVAGGGEFVTSGLDEHNAMLNVVAQRANELSGFSRHSALLGALAQRANELSGLNGQSTLSDVFAPARLNDRAGLNRQMEPNDLSGLLSALRAASRTQGR